MVAYRDNDDAGENVEEQQKILKNWKEREGAGVL